MDGTKTGGKTPIKKRKTYYLSETENGWLINDCSGNPWDNATLQYVFADLISALNWLEQSHNSNDKK